MPPVGFEPTIPASERPQTYALDRAATGNGRTKIYVTKNKDLHISILTNQCTWVYECNYIM